MNKVTIRISNVFIACMTLGVIHVQAQTLDLYLNPDTQSKKIDTVKLDDARLGEPAPVANDALAALGWQYAPFKGLIRGFVPDAKIGKDMLPVNDTIIREDPSEDSAALGVYTYGDPVTIIDTGSWWQIAVQTTFPVYFVDQQLPATSLFEEQTSVAIEPAPLELAPPATISDDTVLFNETVDGPSEAAPPVSIAQRENEPRMGVLARSYTGHLERSKTRLGLFRAKAPYQLTGDDGRRLLWVTFAETILPGTINMFLGKDVIVHGEPIVDEKSKDWILYVRTIRENR
jgi:hypothetical protein